LTELRLLRREEVLRRIGVKRTTLQKMLDQGELPPPIVVTGNVRAWPESTITAFIEARIAASQANT
jgi:predicted DNA-binding transcriptional regulator AlpA